MAVEHTYSCVIVHGGIDGNFTDPFMYASTHRAGSKANADDALRQWKRDNGNNGWAEIEHGSVYRVY